MLSSMGYVESLRAVESKKGGTNAVNGCSVKCGVRNTKTNKKRTPRPFGG